jgi:integrase
MMKNIYMEYGLDLRVRDISFDESKTYIILHGKGNKSRRIAISEML